MSLAKKPSGPHAVRSRMALWAVLLLLLAGISIVIMASAADLNSVLPGANAYVGSFCTRTGNGLWEDEESAARSEYVNDVIMGAQNGAVGASTIYIGALAPFQELLFKMGTSGSGGSLTWQYRTSAGWSSLSMPAGKDLNEGGTVRLAFDPPVAWAPTEIDAEDCPDGYYYLKATSTYYTVMPVADQVSLLMLNLRVKVLAESGAPLDGLTESSFIVTENGGMAAPPTTIYAFKPLGGGTYELALYAGGGNANFKVEAAPAGYVKHQQGWWGLYGAGASMVDKASSPFNVRFPVQVTVGQVTNLDGITWERRSATGAYAAVAPAWTSGSTAYFAQPPSDGAVAYKASKATAAGESSSVTASDVEVYTRTLALTEGPLPPPPPPTSELIGATVTASVLGASDTSEYTFTAKTTSAWPADGKLSITFPDGHILAGATASFDGGTTGAVTISGTTVTVGRTAPLAAGSTFTVNVKDARNPSTQGKTGAFQLATLNGAGATIDSATLDGVTVYPPGTKGPVLGQLRSLTHPLGIWSTLNAGEVSWAHIGGKAPVGFSWATDGQPDDAFESTVPSLTAAPFTVTGDGVHTVRIKAKDSAGDWGPVVEHEVRVDRSPPTSVVTGQPESGLIMKVQFEAVDQGAGVKSVQVWVKPDTGVPILVGTYASSEGTATFSGVLGHTYEFSSKAVDLLGHEEIVATAAGVVVAVTENKLVPGDDVMAILAQLLGRVGLLEDRLYGIDDDLDGVIDRIAGIEQDLLNMFRPLPAEPGTTHTETIYLIDKKETTAGERQTVIWSPHKDQVDTVRHVVPVGEPTQEERDGRPVVQVTVPKESGWIMFQVPDPAPDRPILQVVRADGVVLPSSYAWRSEGGVFILDDPETQYEIQYGDATKVALPWAWIGSLLAGFALLGAIAVVALRRRSLRSRAGGPAPTAKAAKGAVARCPRCGGLHNRAGAVCPRAPPPARRP